MRTLKKVSLKKACLLTLLLGFTVIGLNYPALLDFWYAQKSIVGSFSPFSAQRNALRHPTRNHIVAEKPGNENPQSYKDSELIKDIGLEPVDPEFAVTAGRGSKEKVFNSATYSYQGAPQSRLIILAYMRTGSSMTGSLFNNHPDVFYWYEPLHTQGARYNKKHSDIEKWKQRNMFRSSGEAVGNVSALLYCDSQNVFGENLMDGFMAHGKGTADFKQCFRDGSRDFALSRSRTVWEDCVRNLTAVCRKDYRVVAMKTIRFSMSGAVELMKNDPGLKVIHLVRDPRAILESRARLGFSSFRQLETEAYNMCEFIAEDLETAQSLKEEGMQQRYMLVRYEDIAKSLLLATKLMYQFVGVQPAQQGLEFAEKISQRAPGRRKPCPTCPAETSNSTARSLQWRQSAAIKNVEVVSEQCSALMTQLGYRVRFRDEAELLDSAVPSVLEPRVNVATSFIQDVSEEDLP